jgi:hypothetical protein
MTALPLALIRPCTTVEAPLFLSLSHEQTHECAVTNNAATAAWHSRRCNMHSALRSFEPVNLYSRKLFQRLGITPFEAR